MMKKKIESTSDLDLLRSTFKELNIVFFEDVDEYDCTELRIKYHEHNALPMFYFDENGKFIEVDVASGVGYCSVCGAIESCIEKK